MNEVNYISRTADSVRVKSRMSTARRRSRGRSDAANHCHEKTTDFQETRAAATEADDAWMRHGQTTTRPVGRLRRPGAPFASRPKKSGDQESQIKLYGKFIP